MSGRQLSAAGLVLTVLVTSCAQNPPSAEGPVAADVVTPVQVTKGITTIALKTAQPELPGRRQLAGTTMGTSLNIVLAVNELGADEARRVIALLVDRLVEIDNQMSTWNPESELSRFNAHKSTEPFPVSLATATVTAEALRVWQQSDGWYDVTVGPLVHAWGFNTKAVDPPAPDAATIEKLLQSVGSDKLKVSLDPPTLTKSVASLEVDLSSIAKGYGVDVVSQVLVDAGYPAHFVEIGGEVVARGQKLDGDPWRSGIREPKVGVLGQPLPDRVIASDLALATSGDYFNTRTVGGRRIQHTIDPRTGQPIDNRLASVSIIAPNCTQADALATAVMAMGADRGMKLIDDIADVEGMLLLRLDDGNFERRISTGFAKHLK